MPKNRQNYCIVKVKLNYFKKTFEIFKKFAK